MRVPDQCDELLRPITSDPEIVGAKPIIRGRRLAVEHVLALLAAGDDERSLLAAYWLEPEDVETCRLYSRRLEEGQGR